MCLLRPSASSIHLSDFAPRLLLFQNSYALIAAVKRIAQLMHEFNQLVSVRFFGCRRRKFPPTCSRCVGHDYPPLGKRAYRKSVETRFLSVKREDPLGEQKGIPDPTFPRPKKG